METAVEPRGQAAVLGALIAVGLLAAVGWTVSRQFRWTAVRDGPLLRTTAGLVTHRNGVLEVDRVHAVRSGVRVTKALAMTSTQQHLSNTDLLHYGCRAVTLQFWSGCIRGFAESLQLRPLVVVAR